MNNESGAESISSALIASITPYFIDRPAFWFEENSEKILKIRRMQSFWQDNTLFLEKGQSCSLSNLLRTIDEMGYEKVLQVAEQGEFSNKGGILEIFPINSLNAVRFDFYGNTIESIEKLDIKIEDEKAEKERLKKKLKSQKVFSDLKGLKPGDYLVHLDHGIGKFAKAVSDEGKNFYLLEYAQGDKLYVPFGLERKLSRYVGFSEPRISRLGSPVWEKTKKKTREEAEKLAKELLNIYAKREISSRPPYNTDSEMEKYLEQTFPYEETPDQLRAMEEIKEDLKRTEPMDRIVCGDVGFGKTEIALRTMVLAVESGHQAAMICPSTILADQHYQNFKKRLKNTPLEIKMISRLQTKKEQKEAIEMIKEGKADIVIGTHRLLSKDVEWQKSFGLLVIDDEQKFGVKQKEKFKEIRPCLDILSLSATPIPRTLYLALSSLKEITLVQTPPPERRPVKTYIGLWSEKTIKEAIQKELQRKGQVYYLHNRVETIGSIKRFLEKMSSGKWKIGVVHGRMEEKKLLKEMQDFQDNRTGILLATTIIENGLDLPNVNTLIVADATRLGLSQAYQIRGRIGRSFTQAFAYFFHQKNLGGKAEERLKALKEAQEIGSGYRVALKDLEIRGAGNVLGKEQSGSINQVGLNLYCQMISEAVEKMKNQ